MKLLTPSLVAASLVLSSCGEETKPTPAYPAVSQALPQPAPEPAKPAETQPIPAPTPAPAAQPVVAATPAKPTYTVRAEVDTLPGIESSVLRLHHERIPNFAGKDGKVGTDSQGKPGMKPMTMSFAKGPGVSYEGLKAGDKVEVVVEMNWEAALPDERIVITKLTRLAPETKLDFEGQRSLSDPKPVTPKPEPK
ncbi:MAG: copper-binding protein [Phycisphaerales bacterium]|nr:copper-binding protein [Phycisphaerales bacterium]